MTAPEFAPVLNLIRQAQARALHHVNRELIELYWQIGEYLHRKTEQDGWGRGTVRELATWLAKESPEARGFSAQNLWRMKQFYETYSANPKLSALLRELTWTNNITILGRANSEQKREFYLQAAIQGRWTQRELIRQIDGSLYERALTGPAQLSPVLQEQQPLAAQIFSDNPLLGEGILVLRLQDQGAVQLNPRQSFLKPFAVRAFSHTVIAGQIREVAGTFCCVARNPQAMSAATRISIGVVR